MEHTLESTVAIKREMNKFLNRFFYSKEKSKENLALMYFYLDDFIRYINDLQADVGTELLQFDDFDEVFLEKEKVKVFLDEELKVILIDSITQKEKFEILMDRNKQYKENLDK